MDHLGKASNICVDFLFAGTKNLSFRHQRVGNAKHGIENGVDYKGNSWLGTGISELEGG